MSEFAGNKIRRVTPDGRVKTIAGTGTAGGVNGLGSAATFQSPTGVAVDSVGNIYVCEDANRVRKIVFNGGDPTLSSNYTVSTLAGASTAGFADGTGTAAKFTFPRGITTDPQGNVYVADYSNFRIRFINPQGEVTTIAGTGVNSDSDGSGATATLSQPIALTYFNGGIYVAENGGKAIRQLTLATGSSPTQPDNWTVATLAGNGTSGSLNGTGLAAEFTGPTGIAADNSGGLVVAAFGEQKIRKVTPASGHFPLGTATGTLISEPVQLANATGVTANTFLPYISYPGSLAPKAASTAQSWLFAIPQGVTAFEFTVSVQADTALTAFLQAALNAGSPLNQVGTLAGNPLAAGFKDGIATTAQFDQPYQIALDAAGNAFVADNLNDSIRRIDPNGNVSTVAGGFVTPGFVNGPGNVASFGSPKGVAVTPDGTTVYVADANEIRCLSISVGADPTNSANWTVSTIAGSTTAGNNSGVGTSAQFNLPWTLAIASGNLLYVAEFGGNRIRQMQLMGGDRTVAANWDVSVFAGSTTASAGFTGGQGTAALFNGPEGICVDKSGNIYVTEPSNEDIRKITPGGFVSGFAGPAQGTTPTFGYADGPATTALFDFPVGICVDGAGYVYVGEFNGEKVRRVSPSGFVETVAGTGAGGSADGTGDTATFGSLRGLAMTASGSLLVSDNSNCIIRTVQTVMSQGAPAKRK